MEKLFRSWKIIFSLALVMVFLGLYFFLLGNEMKTPAKGWSKEVLIQDVDNNKLSEYARVISTSIPVPGENRFFTFWNEKNLLKYVSIGNDGVKGPIKQFGLKLDVPAEIKAKMNNGTIDIYILEGGILKKLNFDYKTEKLSSEKLIGSKVNVFKFRGDSLFLAGENYIKSIDANGRETLLSNFGGNVMDVLDDDAGGFRVAFVRYDKVGNMHLMFTRYNPSNSEIKTDEISMLISSSDGIGLTDVVMYKEKDNVSIILPRRNLMEREVMCTRVPPKADTNMIIYNFNENNIKNLKYSFLKNIGGFNPNPIRIESSLNGINMMASVWSYKGNKTQMLNIREYTLNNGNVEPGEFLTWTEEISVNPEWFAIGNDNFLQWEDITGEGTRIMYASSNSNVIKDAGKVTSSIAGAILMDTITDLGFSFSYLLLFFACIILPTLLLMLIISAFFMNLVETRSRLVAQIFIGIHILSECGVSLYLRGQKPAVVDLMPGIMQNIAGTFGLIIVLGIVSYYCMTLKYRDDRMDKSPVNQYAFFAVINMILYALLFFPYYYI